MGKMNDLQGELKRTREALEHAKRQTRELRQKLDEERELRGVISKLSDAMVISMAQRYGERRDNDDGELLGYRLEFDRFKADELVKEFEIKAENIDDKTRVIGVIRRINDEDEEN